MYLNISKQTKDNCHLYAYMKKIILLFIISIFSLNTYAQELAFSDSIEISLLTCSPGPEAYAKFGHSGLRVVDKQKGYDIVFNWGIFNFNTNNFYIKFIKGETDYLLGAQLTSDFLTEYKERNSVVWEHIINLNKAEKEKLIDLILTNYKPENRTYRYNFVYDNCATRPRDLILGSINGHVVFQQNYEARTYRQAIDEYVGEDNWLRFGIDLVFGYQADKNMPQLQSMFLPEMLKYEFVNARIFDLQYKHYKPLINKSNTIVSSLNIEQKPVEFTDSPFNVFLAMLVLIFLISAYELVFDKRYNNLIDSLLLFATGLGGLIVFFLMFFSLHPLVKFNLNILWLNPLNIIAAVLIWFKRYRIQLFFFQLFNLALVALALIAVAMSVQTFNQATFLVIAILLFRYSAWIYRAKKRIVRKLKFQKENKDS